MSNDTTQNKKYLIWNNKGGVGKTFLTYVLALEYALQHPDEDVAVIDACPQSNVSEMLLGGNGKGEQNLTVLRNNEVTIAGYIKRRYETSRFKRLGNESGYFIQCATLNRNCPSNVYLLPGDVDLDICSALIGYLSSAPERHAWAKSRSFLTDLIESFETRHQASKRPQVFFVDCNPSFANYTELAVLATNRIVVPCTSDAASLRGIENLFKLIYGVSLKKAAGSSEDVFLFFNQSARDNALPLPLIHSFVLNRSRSHLKDAATAFKSHAQEIEKVANDFLEHDNSLFFDAEAKVFNVKDGNTLASILNHEGVPLSNLQQRKYVIYGQETQANNTQIEPLLEDVKKVVASL